MIRACRQSRQSPTDSRAPAGFSDGFIAPAACKRYSPTVSNGRTWQCRERLVSDLFGGVAGASGGLVALRSVAGSRTTGVLGNANLRPSSSITFTWQLY